MSLRFLNVLGPAFVIASRINGQSHYLHVSPIKLWFDFGHVTELGRTDRCEVLWMREQDGPRVADPIVETDSSFRGFCFKIRCYLANFHLFCLFSFLRNGYFKSRCQSQHSLRYRSSCCAINSQNLVRSMLPPETIATIGPLPAFLFSAAATGNAPAPSEITRAFSARSRIA